MDGGNIAIYEHIECQRCPQRRGAALQRSWISSKHLLPFDMSIPGKNYVLPRRRFTCRDLDWFDAGRIALRTTAPAARANPSQNEKHDRLGAAHYPWALRATSSYETCRGKPLQGLRHLSAHHPKQRRHRLLLPPLSRRRRLTARLFRLLLVAVVLELFLAN